ncbi:MAG: hypothetical protein C0483_06320 [Pirellula sp.]|nr:hypothetical protein [Pirellula sp.]
MRILNKLLVIVAVATLATQPIVLLAKPCACHVPDAAANSHDEPAVGKVAEAIPSATLQSCCAARNEHADGLGITIPENGPRSHSSSCSLRNISHAVGDCCCSAKVPESATPAGTVASVDLSASHALTYIGVASASSDVAPLLSALRFGSPAELAYSSHPAYSILYGVWRN